MPGDGFYDTERLRFKGPRLWRAYELLYPRDTWTLTPEILEMVGMQGIAALWMDCGHWKRGTIRFGGIRTHLQDGDFLLLAQYLVEQGIPCHVENRGATIYGVNITPSRTSDFAAAIRPYVHRSMRNRLSKPRR